MTSRIKPVIVQSANASTEDSRPKLPPVNIAGPLMFDLINPGSLTPPDTIPEKMADCV